MNTNPTNVPSTKPTFNATPSSFSARSARERQREQARLRGAAPEVLAAFQAKRLSASHVDALMQLPPEDQSLLLGFACELSRESTRRLVNVWLAVRAPVIEQLEEMLFDLSAHVGHRYAVKGRALRVG